MPLPGGIEEVCCPDGYLLSAFWNPYAKHVTSYSIRWHRVPSAVQIVVKPCDA